MIGQTLLRQPIGTVLAIIVGAVGLLLLSALFGNAQAHASGRKDYDSNKHYSYNNHDDHGYKNKDRRHNVKYVKYDKKDRCDRDHDYKWSYNDWNWDDDCDCYNDCDYNSHIRISYSNYDWNWNDWNDDCDDNDYGRGHHQNWDD